MKYQRSSYVGHWSFNLGIRDSLNLNIFRCKHILEKLCGCQHDDFETIVTQGSVVFCIWSRLSLSYVVSLFTCRRSVKRISRNGNDVLWVTYRLPPGVDYWTKLSGISCDKTLPFSKTEFRLKISLGLSFCLMRIPVHGRVKKPWIYDSWSGWNWNEVCIRGIRLWHAMYCCYALYDQTVFEAITRGNIFFGWKFNFKSMCTLSIIYNYFCKNS